MVGLDGTFSKNEWVAARLAQALSHPVRLRILALLREEGAYVMHLTNMLARPQANVSQHLAILREAGLVMNERDGMTVVYRVRDVRVFDVMDHLMVVADHARDLSAGERSGRQEWEGEPAMHRCDSDIGRRGGCNCPRCRGR